MARTRFTHFADAPVLENTVSSALARSLVRSRDGLRSNLDQPPSVNSIPAVTHHNAECVSRNSICARLFGERSGCEARFPASAEGRKKEEKGTAPDREPKSRRVPIRVHCLYFVALPSGVPVIDPVYNRARSHPLNPLQSCIINAQSPAPLNFKI